MFKIVSVMVMLFLGRGSFSGKLRFFREGFKFFVEGWRCFMKLNTILLVQYICYIVLRIVLIKELSVGKCPRGECLGGTVCRGHVREEMTRGIRPRGK